MTTWMAPAGMVLIVGGITTLIVFRGFLFGAGGKGRGSSKRAATSAEAASRAAARAERRAQAEELAAASEHEEAAVTGRKGRRGRGTRAVEASAAANPAAVVAAAPTAEDVPAARFSPPEPAGFEPSGPGPAGFERTGFVPPGFEPPGLAAAGLGSAGLGSAGLGSVGEAEVGEVAGGDPELDAAVDLDRAAELSHDEEAETALVFASPDEEPGPNPWEADRSGLHYGDRVDGWVRPEYHDEPGVGTGDYWTPAPESSYGARFGWPIPVERLPEVPPSTRIVGFDPPPEMAGEPVPEALQWPPLRPEVPVAEEAKSAFFPDAPPRIPPGPYAAREEILEGPIWRVPDLPESDLPDLTWSVETFADDDGPTPRSRRSATVVRRRRGITAAGGQDPTQALPQLDPPQQTDLPTRTRPRPRPRPGAAQPDARSTVYVSRHAAEPS